jgi:hypothetical protein
MIANLNTGSLLMAFVIVGIVIYLAATGRLPRRDGELERLRKLEAKMAYLQDEDIHKGQEIATLRRENTELRERIKYLEGQLAKPPTPSSTDERGLLVVTGADTQLQIDVAALRGARGLRMTTLLATSYNSLKLTLERHRRPGRPDELVHFAVHAGPEGIMLDRLVTREELSALLRGTLVCVIMGCTSAEVGDLLTVVPTVVAFNKPVDHSEAWQWSVIFWKAIGEGLTPSDAFDRTQERGPTKICEAAELIEL